MKISLHHTLLCFVIISSFLASCSVSRVSSERKFPAKQLKEDFSIFRGALEESHPSLYWFTPKEQMDAAFSEVYSHLNDSMTERQFRTQLLKVITSIRCGHTSINYSKRFSRYLDTAGLKLFPLGV